MVSIERSGIELPWSEIFHRMGASWTHGGNPARPHPVITSGKHSDSYTNSELVLQDPVILDRACRDLVRLLLSAGVDLGVIRRVIGPEKGAIRIAHDLARQISIWSFVSEHCLSAYAEKVTDGADKFMVLARVAIGEGERVLLAEDVLTTGCSVRLTAMAVENAGGIVLPYVCTLVNSSRQSEVDGRKVIALAEY